MTNPEKIAQLKEKIAVMSKAREFKRSLGIYDMKIYGGILAGGIGTRMATANGLPKQFLEVGGVPVIVRTVRRFLELHELERLIVALGPDWMEYARKMLEQNDVDMSRVQLIHGGVTRFESLVNLARAVQNTLAADEEALLINHDCARPFVTAQILRANIAAMADYDATTTSIPTIDTVLISEDGRRSDSVLERKTVFLDQGPQTIRVRHFLRLVETLTPDERSRYMEAGRLYLEKGYRVGIVPGARENFKLTTPFDMTVAEQLLKKGGL